MVKYSSELLTKYRILVINSFTLLVIGCVFISPFFKFQVCGSNVSVLIVKGADVQVILKSLVGTKESARSIPSFSFNCFINNDESEL